MKLHFLGACRQVTGSCYYLEAGGLRVLIDCGVYQERAFLARNWDPFPVAPDAIDYLLLTHAHLDHSGLIPKLVREGYSGPILATPPTVELTEIVLLDSGRIQEEDVEFKRKRHERQKRTGPFPLVPLYTEQDADRALPLLREAAYEEPISLNDRVSVRFCEAGHILGSAMLELTIREDGESRRLIFSGDIGQRDRPLIRDPSVFEQADYVVMESTYGDRNHLNHGEPVDLLADVVNRTVAKGGNLVVPVFAIERAQELLFYLGRLVREDRIPHLMMYLDSPMAVDVADVFRKHSDCLDRETLEMLRTGHPLFEFPGLTLVRTTEESKAINRIKGSCIIMAGSGMCTGGRIKHHIAANIERKKSTILFVGFQAKDTLGRQLVDHRPKVRIHGEQHTVNARIEQIHGFSGHADRKGLLEWLGHLQPPPRRLFLTHGDEEVTLKLALEIRSQLGWEVSVPEYREVWDLG